MSTTGQERGVDAYELSPTQAGMLYHGLLDEATGVDLEAQTVPVRSRAGEVDLLPFDRLVLAPGSVTRLPSDVATSNDAPWTCMETRGSVTVRSSTAAPAGLT